MDVESLCVACAQGKRFKYLFFWGHRPKLPGRVDASCLSQWFAAPFIVDGVRYATAEHWMMAEKARLFDDEKMLAQILAAPSPGKAKALGRQVRGYDDTRWADARFDAVVEGSVQKFEQNKAFGDFLRNTGDRVLVEASPRDRIWGIGMGKEHQDAGRPQKWRGQNLLGFALMEARARIGGRAL